MIDGAWRYDPNEESLINKYNTYDNIVRVIYLKRYSLLYQKSLRKNQIVKILDNRIFVLKDIL